MGPVVFSVGVALSTARLESQELSPKQREGPEVPGAGRGGRAQSWRARPHGRGGGRVEEKGNLSWVSSVCRWGGGLGLTWAA